LIFGFDKHEEKKNLSFNEQVNLVNLNLRSLWLESKIADFRVFHCLVKKWLQILKDDMEEPLLARLIFKDNLFESVNHIFCNLFALVNPITNNFRQCRVIVLTIHDN